LVHTVAELRSATIFDLMERTDAFRRPERFRQMLIACEADFRGRTGYADRSYPQAGELRRLFDAALAVDVAALAVAAAEPRLIARRIRQARITAIRQARPDRATPEPAGPGQP
jgi:tRNA nucleotidyltransferase (CCA-adding enzyme)